MKPQHFSNAEIYTKRSNRILLILGICLFLIFVLAFCNFSGGDESTEPVSDYEGFGPSATIPMPGEPESGIKLPDHGGKATLQAIPGEIVLTKVHLGSTAEAIISVSAVNAPIVINGWALASNQAGGFDVSSDCVAGASLSQGESCVFTISWNPVAVRQIENTLFINWKENNPAIFTEEKLAIPLKADSTDQSDCVVCSTVLEKPDLSFVYGPGGEILGEVGEGGEFTGKDGKKYRLNEFGFLLDENGKIVGIMMPQKVPLALDGTLLGRMTPKGDVVAQDGTMLGKSLPDGTIINEDLKVVGGYVYLASVINESGDMIGELKPTGVVVDKEGFALGSALPDGTVLDKDNKIAGYLRPSGLVMDFNGKIIGGVMFEGTVINVKGDILGKVLPNGLVVSAEELPTLIGAVVPAGVAIQAGCTSGQLLMNGQVRDAFDQVIGTTDIEGRIFTSDHKLIGQVVRAGLIMDAGKNIIGYISKEGKALDKRGSVMGCVNPDGSVVAGKKVIGALMPKGIVLDTSCQFLGTVMPDGKIQKGADKTNLTVGVDGWAGFDNAFSGAVVAGRTAFSDSCGLLGIVSPTGHVKTLGGAVLGCTDAKGYVLNERQESIGRVLAASPVLDANSQSVGYVQSNGTVVSAAQQKLGCVNAEGVFQSSDGDKIGWSVFATSAQHGAILNAAGQTTGWSVLGDQVYDVVGNLLGHLVLNRWVVDLSGQLIGQIQDNGSIVDSAGKFVNRYFSVLGTTLAGESILPDKTALDKERNKIVGGLVSDDACYADQAGKLMSCIVPNDITGDAKTVGTVLPNGIVKKENKEVGYLIPSGLILAPFGQTIGYATPSGNVFSLKQKRMGTVLGNGLVVGGNNDLLGRVISEPAVVIQGESFVGTVAPNGLVRDVNGRQVGWASPFKYAFTLEGRPAGRLVPVRAMLNADGGLSGWLSYRGKQISALESMSERVFANGLALTDGYDMAGAVRSYAPVISETGTSLGYVNVMGKPADDVAFADGVNFYRADHQLAGRIVPLSVGLDNQGKPIGFSGPNGLIGTTRVLSDNTLVHTDTDLILGMAVPLGEVALSETNEPLGIVNTNGSVINKDGQEVGSIVAGGFVMRNNQIVGKLAQNDAFVAKLSSAVLQGFAQSGGEVVSLSEAKQIGESTSSSFVWGFVNNLIGHLLAPQSAFGFNLKPLGRFLLNGQIAGTTNKATGVGVVFNHEGKMNGYTALPVSVADEKGQYLGTPAGTKLIGKAEGVRLPLGAVLTPENKWLGGVARKGLVLSDTGESIGMVQNDGTIQDADKITKARQTGTGYVIATANPNEYAYFPAVGQVPVVGLPIGLYSHDVLGRQTLIGTIKGDGKEAGYTLTDTGMVRNRAGEPAGMVVPVLPALDMAGNVLGMPSEGGQVIDFSGREAGVLASNGAVKQGNFFNIVGGIVPTGVVVNNCQVIGQADYTGKVIDAAGEVKGKIGFDGSFDGGYIPLSGNVVSESGEVVGFARPDGTVMDAGGVPIGCVNANGVAVSAGGSPVGVVAKRGLVFSKAGALMGFVGLKGQVLDKANAVVGQMKADGSDMVVNETDEVGFVVPFRREVALNPNGTLAGSLDLSGVFYDNQNQPVLQTTPNRTIIELKTNQPIALITEDGSLTDLAGNRLPQLIVLLDNDGFTTGLISGCQMVNMQGQVIGTVQSDGTIIDSNQNVFAIVGSGGVLLGQDRTQIGRIVGQNTQIEMCVQQTEAATGFAGRRIVIDNKVLRVTDTGSLVNDLGTIVGYMGQDGRPYSLDNQPITSTSGDGQGRRRPDLNKKMQITPEQIDQMQQLLVQRRAAMQMGGVIKPDAKLLARKNYKDKDWGWGKNISSWPVDMSRVILRDKAIPAVLAHSIDSRYLDVPVTAIVERHIYSERGRNVLIPAGSRLIGAVTGAPGTDHVAKLQISWTRLIRPDGSAFTFEATSGDAQGRGGVAAYLDEQTLERYGQPVLTAALTSGINYLMTTNEKVETKSDGTVVESDKSRAAQDARDNINDAMQQVFAQMIADSTRAPAVVFVPSGTRLTAFPNEDLWLRSITDDEAEQGTTYDVRTAPRTTKELDQSAIYHTEDHYTTPAETGSKEVEPQELEPIIETVGGGSERSSDENESVLYDGTENISRDDLEDRTAAPVLPRPTSAEIY